MSIPLLLVICFIVCVSATRHLITPFKSIINRKSSCNDRFNTTSVFNLQLAFLSTGEAFIEIAVEPVPKENYSITVKASTNVVRTFSNWQNYKFNGIVVFRRSLGKFVHLNELFCTVTINNVSRVLSIRKTLPIVNYTGAVPANKTFSIQPLQHNSTLHGKFEWTNDALYENEKCSKLLKEMLSLPPLPLQYTTVIKNKPRGTKVYLSLTTSPNRLLKLHYVLQSLDLSLVDTIFITIPELYKNNTKYKIPRTLVTRFPKIQFLSASIDIGPALKVVGPSEFLKGKDDGNGILIIIDDDNVYNKSTIGTFIYFSMMYPNSAISSSDINFISTFAYPPVRSYRHSFLSATYLVEGFCGFASRLRNFDSELITAFSRRDLNGALSCCYQSDDIIISFALALRGCHFNNTHISNTPFHTKLTRRDLPYYLDEFALHRLQTNDQKTNSYTNPEKYAQVMEVIGKFAIDYTSADLKFKNRDDIIKSIVKSYQKK